MNPVMARALEMFRVAFGASVALAVSTAPAQAACPVQPTPPATTDIQGFKGRIFEKDGKTMPYRLFVPPSYDAAKQYPLVLYLHHAGLANTDNCIQLTEEIGSGGYGGVFVHQAVAADNSKFDTQTKYPHIVLAPQAPTSNYGFGGGVEGSASGPVHETRPLVFGILDAVRAELNVDARRIYVTGISMGCYGTWDLIMRNPDYFAAASPQSCRGDPDESLLAKLVKLPVWSMCGTEDSYFAGAQAMADGMEAVGAEEFTFTAMEGVGHSIHNLGYDYPGFIDWMFAQSRPAPMEPNGGAGGSAGAAGASGSAVAGGGAGGADGAGGTPSAGAPVSSMSGSSGSAGASGAGGSGPVTAPSANSSSCALGAKRQAPWAYLLPLAWLARRRRKACS